MLNFSANLSLLYNDVPLLQRFERAAKAGFKTVEIQFPYELTIAEISAQLKAHQLQLDLINIPVGNLMQGGDGLAGVLGKQAEFKQAVDLCISYACALGVPKVNILSGRQADNDSEKLGWQVLVENTCYACQQLIAAGITPVVEVINPISMPRFWVQSLPLYYQLKQDIGFSELKLQFDAFHIAMLGLNVVQTFEQNFNEIGHIQFADCPNRHEPYTGQVDFNDFFYTVKISSYTGFTAAEYIPTQQTEAGLAWLQQWQNV